MAERIGVDEVGRGPLAGPLTIAAVQCHAPDSFFLSLYPKGEIKDSKALSSTARKKIFAKLKSLLKNGEVSFAVSNINNRLIDMYGLTKAAELGLFRCLKKLNPDSDTQLILDAGLPVPEGYKNVLREAKADERYIEVSLASIIAKETRDAFMVRQNKRFPEYNFETHKGYGTKKHREALLKHGPCTLHRQSFLSNLLSKE